MTPSYSSSLPTDANARYIEHTKIPDRCGTCSIRYERTRDETGQIWFCGNKHCGTAGWGYHQDPNTGLITDGVFNKALTYLRKRRY